MSLTESLTTSVEFVVITLFFGELVASFKCSVMAERLNMVVCTFDPASPRLTAYDIHEWLHAELRIQESQVSMIQIDGIKRQVFIKMVDKDSMHAVVRDTCGRAKYK